MSNSESDNYFENYSFILSPKNKSKNIEEGVTGVINRKNMFMVIDQSYHKSRKNKKNIFLIKN